MKLPDLEHYHIVKNELKKTITDAEDSEPAAEASLLITTMENSMKQRMDCTVFEAINIMVSINNMLKAELENKAT